MRMALIALMTKTSLFLAPVIALLCLSGCSKPKWTYRPQAVPKDEATAEERKQIDDALMKISDLTEKFGTRREFKNIPIVVTTEDARAHKRDAYCAGSFIALNRGLFDKNTVFPHMPTILLHEIGHCYFGRGHDSQVFSKPGFNVVFYKHDLWHPGSEYQVNVCATVMCKDGYLPFPLLEYYVGELMGRPRVKDISELKTYGDFALVPMQ
jgi:hypothetical protein